MRVLVIFLAVFFGAVAFAPAGPPPPRADLAKRVAALEKENKALKSDLDAEKRRSNARDMLLAGWFDEYHPRGGNSRYHRNQVEWKKR